MRQGHKRASTAAGWGLWVLVGSTSTASGQNAVRDLPDVYVPGVRFTVSISITLPGDPVAVGIEDGAPPGWVVSNISHKGVFDGQNKKVKWGPFFRGSIPPAVAYEVRSTGSVPGEQCFAGKASFDALNQSIGGDQCLPHSVPTLSGVALGGLAVLFIVIGAATIFRGTRSADRDH